MEYYQQFIAIVVVGVAVVAAGKLPTDVFFGSAYETWLKRKSGNEFSREHSVRLWTVPFTAVPLASPSRLVCSLWKDRTTETPKWSTLLDRVALSAIDVLLRF